MISPARLILFLAAGVCHAVTAQAPADAKPEKAVEPTLQARLYDAAGALGNEGFKVRDGAWSGSLEGDKSRRLAVNLFAGNEYWFCAAIAGAGEVPVIVLRDPSGAEVETVAYQGGGIAAVGVTAPATGRYILSLRSSGSATREFCLLYLFK